MPHISATASKKLFGFRIVLKKLPPPEIRRGENFVLLNNLTQQKRG